MVEFESLEERIEEYVDVIEESIDVDVDKKAIGQSKGCAKCGICQLSVHNFEKHIVEAH